MPHKGFNSCVDLLFRSFILFFVWGAMVDLVAIIYKKYLFSPQPSMSSVNLFKVEDDIDGIIWRATPNCWRFSDLCRATRFHFGGTIFEVTWVCGELLNPWKFIICHWLMRGSFAQIAPTFGLFAGFAQDKCGQDLACVCRKSGFVFLAAVQGAIAKTCSFSNQTGEPLFAAYLLH